VYLTQEVSAIEHSRVWEEPYAYERCLLICTVGSSGFPPPTASLRVAYLLWGHLPPPVSSRIGRDQGVGYLPGAEGLGPRPAFK
jgi:hypothetical protein